MKYVDMFSRSSFCCSGDCQAHCGSIVLTTLALTEVDASLLPLSTVNLAYLGGIIAQRSSLPH